MRSPAFPPDAVLVTVNVRVWVVPMSTSPGATGEVCVRVNDLAACAVELAAASETKRRRKPQRFMLPSWIPQQQVSRPDRSWGKYFSRIANAGAPGPGRAA